MGSFVAISKDKSGRWLVHVDRKGLPRVRRAFGTRVEAVQFEREYVASKTNAPVQLTNADVLDNRRLKELSPLWFRYHGVNLSDGVRRQECLDNIAVGLGNPVARELSPEMWVKYRFERMQAGLSGNTFNNHQKYVSAMYTKLFKLRIIDYPNPLANVDLVRMHERQLSYLSIGQIKALFASIELCRNRSVYYVAQLCIRTGARFGEADRLRMKQLRGGMVTYEFTKSRKTRSIPLDPLFYAQLLEFANGKNPDDRLFTPAYPSFRLAMRRSGIQLPPGQCSHVLRHSFASYFVINGGNIVSLQKILGHADIKMTMRYAHLSPDHFQDALRLNPLAANWL